MQAEYMHGFDVEVSEDKRYYFYRNINSDEKRLAVPKKNVERLSRDGGISINEAICILGKIKEIYTEALKTVYNANIFTEELIEVLSKILQYGSIDVLWSKLLEMKYREIERIVESEEPLEMFQEM